MKKRWIQFYGVALLGGVLCVVDVDNALVSFASGQAAIGSSENVRRDAVVAAVEKVMPSVVNISTETIVERRGIFDDIWRDFYGPYSGRRKDVQYSLGSGVIIDEEGYILTNLHVVQRATRIWVSLSDGRKLEAETVSDLQHSDVALLKLKDAAGEKFKAVNFAAEDDLYLGETVIALGNPFGLGGSVSRGILSSKNRRPAAEGVEMDVQDWLQIDAAINPGNSGGPLINLDGNLIGLNVAIYRQGEGIGFAIPIRLISEAMSLMLTPESLGKQWFGSVLEVRGGLVFKSVEVGSPADQAGIKPGDILRDVNGTAVAGILDANRKIVAASKDGKPVQLSLGRGSETVKVSAKLLPESSYFNADYIRKRLGIKVEKLTSELAESLGVQMGNAFAVMEVDSGEELDKAGIRPGMLIYGLDGQAVTEMVPFARGLYAKAAGQKVRLAIQIQRRRGNYLETRNVEVEATLK